MAAVRAEPYEFEFDPRSCALVIIDMQRDFVDPGDSAQGRRLWYAYDVYILVACSSSTTPQKPRQI